MIQTLEQLKKWFRTGCEPTQSQFSDVFDSFRHKSENIPLAQVEGLTAQLNAKYDRSEANTLLANMTKIQKRLDDIDDVEAARQAMEEIKKSFIGRSYTLDFGATETTLQDVNMEGADVEVAELLLFNVAKLYVTSGDLVKHEIDPANIGNLTFAAGALTTWEIERAGDAPAAVGVRCTRLTETAEDNQ